MSQCDHPIEAQIVLLAGARASVPLSHLSELIAHAQQHVRNRLDIYERRFERIDGTDGLCYYLVGPDHWDKVGETLGYKSRESDAVRRVHAEQFRRDGRRLNRRDEFETSLEIRNVVTVCPQSFR